MLLRVDHYSSLVRAIARLDRDCYETRGAIYDRAQTALVKRLTSADPPLTQPEIDMELLSFRDAIRRIEFGDLPDQDGDYQAIDPNDAYQDVRQEPEPPDHQQEPAYPDPASVVPPSPLSASADDDLPVAKPKRRSVTGRVISRTAFAATVLGVCLVGYGLVSGEVELPWLAKLMDGSLPALSGGPVAQQAFVYDGSSDDPNTVKAAGTAHWRIGERQPAEKGESGTVLQVDLAIPERRLTMAMSVRRSAPGDVMTHMFEIKFVRDDNVVDADIANIGTPVMTTADHSRNAALIGQVVRVTPGLFLFGLSGTAEDEKRNLQYLKELTWLEIPLTYRGNVPGILSIEKGEAGAKAVEEALAKWGQ